MRLHARVWDRKIRSNIDINPRQKGFVPTDGCYSNVKILQHAICSRRRNGKEANLVFLDLTKAFDTVVHDSIWDGLLDHQVPREVVEGVQQMYGHAITKVEVGLRSTNAIRILSGVKQGCPLSPLLFDLVMNELLERLQSRGIGIQVGSQQIAVMAFTDNLVLVAEEASHMNIALHEYGRFFDQKALRVNVKKCATLRVLSVIGKNSMKVVTDTHRWWRNTPIPSIGFVDLYKYLGVWIQPDGRIWIPKKQWEEMFSNISNSCLKPMQKLRCITQVVIP